MGSNIFVSESRIVFYSLSFLSSLSKMKRFFKISKQGYLLIGVQINKFSNSGAN